MPSDAHLNVRTILCLAALSMTLAACQRERGGDMPGGGMLGNDNGAEATTSPATQTSTGTPASTPPSHVEHPEHWQCGDLLVDSQLDGDTMQLDFSGQALELQQMASPSGMRYADSAGNAFASEGDDASLTLAGGGQYECTRSRRTSPWTEATTRGIAFRAVGNEPGWLVEIGKGGAPSLHASLDYGQRNIDVAQMHPAARSLEGKTADGTMVTLEVLRHACQDGMSGESFEADATLVVGDKTYRGCGAFLSE